MSSPTVLTSGNPNRAFGTLKRVQNTCQESHHRRICLSYAFFPSHSSLLTACPLFPRSPLNPVHLPPHHTVVKVRGQLPGCTAEPVLREAVMSLSYSLTSSSPTWPNVHLLPVCMQTPPCPFPVLCRLPPFSNLFTCPVAPPLLQLSSFPDLFPLCLSSSIDSQS